MREHGEASKKLKLNLPHNPARPLFGIWPKRLGILFHRYLLSPIYNSQEIEATYVLFNRMDNENVVHVHNGILFRCEEK